MSEELIVTNAQILTKQDMFRGSLCAVGGMIEAVDSTPSSLPHAIDLEGDLPIPGLIEIHTDNLEKHLMPRPEVIWPSPMAALLAHDSQICCAGITTALNAVFLESYHKNPSRRKLVHNSVAAIRSARELSVCRSDHMIHLRCELPEESLLEYFETYAQDPLLQLVSLNDHSRTASMEGDGNIQGLLSDEGPLRS